MTRWVPCAPVILPSLPDPRFVVGLPTLTQFKALVASARNWNAIPCSKEKVRKIPRSMSRNPGPRMESRVTLPSAPPGPMPVVVAQMPVVELAWQFAAKAAVLNHAVNSLPVAQIRQPWLSLGLTPGTALGRFAFELSEFWLDPVVIFKGAPLVIARTGAICQPFASTFRNVLDPWK